MEKRIYVDLTGPAKIDGKFRREGEAVAVTMDMARELEAAGAIAPVAGGVGLAELVSGAPGFDEAVQAAAAEIAAGELAELRGQVLVLEVRLQACLSQVASRVSALEAKNVSAVSADAEPGPIGEATSAAKPEEPTKDSEAQTSAAVAAAAEPAGAAETTSAAKPAEQKADKPAPKKQAPAKG